jgi:hypothetical protein
MHGIVKDIKRLICFLFDHKDTPWIKVKVKETRKCPRCDKREYRPLQVTEEVGPLLNKMEEL